MEDLPVEDYFKNTQMEYIFYLTNLQGKQRNDKLGLTDEHYNNEELAEQWYRNVYMNLQGLNNGLVTGYKPAMKNLDKIYSLLVTV